MTILDNNNMELRKRKSSEVIYDEDDIYIKAEYGFKSEGNKNRRNSKSKEPAVLSMDEIQETVKDLSPKERRRERNKLLARRSRLKTKMELESLQERLVELQKQNAQLKNELLKTPQQAPRPFSATELLTSEMHLPENLAHLIKTILQRKDKSMTVRKMEKTSFCISSATARNCPIVFASQGFLRLTGFQRNEIIGKSCKILQGPETDPYAMEEIARGITEGKDSSVTILNYRRDGSTFWNDLQLAHIKDKNGRTIFVVSIQREVYAPQGLAAGNVVSPTAAMINPPHHPMTGYPVAYNYPIQQYQQPQQQQPPQPQQYLAPVDPMNKFPHFLAPCFLNQFTCVPPSPVAQNPFLVNEEIHRESRHSISSDASTGSIF